MKIKIISILLFFLFAISSLTIAGSDALVFYSYSIQHSTVEKLDNTDQASESYLYDPQQFQVNLAERLSLDLNNVPLQEKQKIDTTMLETHKTINLSEELKLSENNFDQNTIAILKQNSYRKATMEGIWNFERIRHNGKSIITNDISWKNEFPMLFETSDSIKDNLTYIAFGIIDTKNSIILLLVPFFAYLLILNECRLKHQNVSKTIIKNKCYLLYYRKHKVFQIFRSKTFFSKLVGIFLIWVLILNSSLIDVAADTIDQGTCGGAGGGSCSALLDTGNSIALADAVATQATRSTSLADSMSLTDTVATTASFTRQLADSMSLT
ncbi:MAG TPA: hypothetical protein VJ201_04315, partial [Candidatus Babeliales bacterium]|nr:hypothetical protein [Candidatus Babeliales bacterium]